MKKPIAALLEMEPRKKLLWVGGFLLTIMVPTTRAFQFHETQDPEMKKKLLPLARGTRHTFTLGGGSSPPNTS